MQPVPNPVHRRRAEFLTDLVPHQLPGLVTTLPQQVGHALPGCRVFRLDIGELELVRLQTGCLGDFLALERVVILSFQLFHFLQKLIAE